MAGRQWDGPHMLDEALGVVGIARRCQSWHCRRMAAYTLPIGPNVGGIRLLVVRLVRMA